MSTSKQTGIRHGRRHRPHAGHAHSAGNDRTETGLEEVMKAVTELEQVFEGEGNRNRAPGLGPVSLK